MRDYGWLRLKINQLPSAPRAWWGLLCEKCYCLTDPDVEGRRSCWAARWPAQTHTDVTLMQNHSFSVKYDVKDTLMLFPARLSHSRSPSSFSPSMYPMLLLGRFRVRKRVSFETPIILTRRLQAADSCEHTAGHTHIWTDRCWTFSVNTAHLQKSLVTLQVLQLNDVVLVQKERVYLLRTEQHRIQFMETLTGQV